MHLFENSAYHDTLLIIPLYARLCGFVNKHCVGFYWFLIVVFVGFVGVELQMRSVRQFHFLFRFISLYFGGFYSDIETD